MRFPPHDPALRRGKKGYEVTGENDFAADFCERAEELRSIAAIVHDKKNREILLRCAVNYEKLAEQYRCGKAHGDPFRPSAASGSKT